MTHFFRRQSPLRDPARTGRFRRRGAHGSIQESEIFHLRWINRELWGISGGAILTAKRGKRQTCVPSAGIEFGSAPLEDHAFWPGPRTGRFRQRVWSETDPKWVPKERGNGGAKGRRTEEALFAHGRTRARRSKGKGKNNSTENIHHIPPSETPE